MNSVVALAQSPEDAEKCRKLPMKRCAFLVALLVATAAVAQSPAPRTEAAEAPDLAALAWLEGCWRGTVNQREYREHWLPLRGGLLVGVSQTVAQGKTQGYEYLRVESRADGVYYVASPSGKSETWKGFPTGRYLTLAPGQSPR